MLISDTQVFRESNKCIDLCLDVAEVFCLCWFNIVMLAFFLALSSVLIRFTRSIGEWGNVIKYDGRCFDLP